MLERERPVIDGAHQGQPVMRTGPSLDEAAGAMLMVHGRGGSAAGILELGREFGHSDCAYLAPQASLSSGLRVLDDLLAQVAASGVPAERTLLLGFSQGACLALEYAARNPRRLGGVVGLSGGLIGPPGTVWNSVGSLDGTPVFLGCDKTDPHIPRERVGETAAAFRILGATVTEKLYSGLGQYDESGIGPSQSLAASVAPAGPMPWASLAGGRVVSVAHSRFPAADRRSPPRVQAFLLQLFTLHRDRAVDLARNALAPALLILSAKGCRAVVILRAIEQSMEEVLGSRIFAVLATVAASLIRAAWNGSALSSALAAASLLVVSTVAVLLYTLARRAIISRCADPSPRPR
jgi:phospholipase/carboxylesterase